MKTPMSVFNTAMKKKKNRKGFSLVELIVVLVIMAILAAALIPSLTGYIRKTKEQNVNSECQSAVQAAQTIESGAFASADGNYTFTSGGTSYTIKGVTDTTSSPDAKAAIKALAEVPGTIESVSIDDTNGDHRITALVYTGKDGSTQCKYELTSDGVGKYTSQKKS